jgi:hypothetical protein
MDKLDEAFLYSEAIDVTTYGRQRDKLREELTLAKIDHHAEAVDELDVAGILAFAERILPRASDLWVQASLDYKQRLQQLFFPEGIAYDGNRFNRTAVTAPLFSYLAQSESADEKMVSRLGIEPRPRRSRERLAAFHQHPCGVFPSRSSRLKCQAVRRIPLPSVPLCVRECVTIEHCVVQAFSKRAESE